VDDELIINFYLDSRLCLYNRNFIKKLFSTG
jgi:hypothetical protein